MPGAAEPFTRKSAFAVSFRVMVHRVCLVWSPVAKTWHKVSMGLLVTSKDCLRAEVPLGVEAFIHPLTPVVNSPASSGPRVSVVWGQERTSSGAVGRMACVCTCMGLSSSWVA